MDEKIALEQALIVTRALSARLQRVWRNRHSEAGMTTLEVAVITLGLLLVAGVVVAVVTAAVKQRTAKIK